MIEITFIPFILSLFEIYTCLYTFITTTFSQSGFPYIFSLWISYLDIILALAPNHLAVSSRKTMMVQDLARQVQNIEQDILKHDSLFLSGRKVLILYGTETGTSQDLAEDLSRRLQRIRFAPTLDEMNGVQLVSAFL